MATTSGTQGTAEAEEYMASDEEISYTLSHRPTGFVSWVKSLFGIGITTWFLTNQRIIEYTNTTGGFNFRDISHDKIVSLEYGSQLSLPALAVGALLIIFGLITLTESPGGGVVLLLIGVGLIAYVFYRRQQTLTVRGSGNVKLALQITKGDNVDEFLWYAHMERRKQQSNDD